jgi:hypothetical protein
VEDIPGDYSSEAIKEVLIFKRPSAPLLQCEMNGVVTRNGGGQTNELGKMNQHGSGGRYSGIGGDGTSRCSRNLAEGYYISREGTVLCHATPMGCVKNKKSSATVDIS